LASVRTKTIRQGSLVLGPGDIVVQRGTMHLGRNPSTSEPCRIVFVLTEAKPYMHNGDPLPEVHP
jgi:hypothetical protein